VSSSHSPGEREERRVAALHALGLLDTPAEALLDHLARSAAAVCGTPMAALNLVDRDRQWTKAQAGLRGLVEVPRSASLCTLVVDSGQYIEIPDARCDDRVSGNACVMQAPALRFYAGAPLATPEGDVIGTLSVADTVRHPPLQEHLRAALQALGGAVMQALLLRQAAHRNVQSSSEHMFRALSQNCPVGIFHTDVQGKCIYTNLHWQELFGMSAEAALGDGWLAGIHA